MSSSPPDWTAAAACLDADPALFFPGRGGRATRAKRICAGCMVRVECLAAAFAGNEEHGIWGGLAADERRQLRRRIEAA